MLLLLGSDIATYCSGMRITSLEADFAVSCGPRQFLITPLVWTGILFCNQRPKKFDYFFLKYRRWCGQSLRAEQNLQREETVSSIHFALSHWPAASDGGTGYWTYCAGGRRTRGWGAGGQRSPGEPLWRGPWTGMTAPSPSWTSAAPAVTHAHGHTQNEVGVGEKKIDS